MKETADRREAWPALTLNEAPDAATTLHMWTQIVGKLRLARAPMINHWWQITLYLTTRGLTTSPMPDGARAFAVDFDLLDHLLRVTTSDGDDRQFALEPMPVAAFYDRLMSALDELNIHVPMLARPVEVVEAIPFAEDDKHASYDADWAQRFWRVMLASAQVMQRFRGRFVGKVSPVHFFWGACDLAVTRFRGVRLRAIPAACRTVRTG